jgi:hypothetical protein
MNRYQEKEKNNDDESSYNVAAQIDDVGGKPYQEPKTKIEILQQLENLDNLDDSRVDVLKVTLTDGLDEGRADDYGYYTIFHTGLQDTESKVKNSVKVDFKGKRHESNFYVTGNFVKHFNLKNLDKREYRTPIETLIKLVKESKNGGNLVIDNPQIVKEKKFAEALTVKKKATKANTNNMNPSTRTNREDECLIKNTENSQIYKKQLINLYEGRIDEALKTNFDYIIRKVKYEVALIKFQLNKYQKYLKNDSKNPIVITADKPFLDLEKNSKKFLKKYEDLMENIDLNKPSARNTLIQYSLEARTFLCDFINGIMTSYEKNISVKRAANERTSSFIIWKTKLSQLVGIWDLSNSNGIEMKSTYKYLMLKRFLIIRALGRQVGKEYLIISEEQRLANKNDCFSGNSNERNTLIHPLGIMKETDSLRKVMEIIVVIFLLYSFITVPARLFMGIESNTLKLIEKFVDMYFYIDIMLFFRTSYKDKSNEDKFDVKEIAKRYFNTYFYIDFFSTIPWYYFFYSTNITETIRVITHIFKIFRISKLMPLISKLEELNQANLIRLIKLLLIFFLIIHWMAAILYFGTVEGILYGVLSPRCYTSDYYKNRYFLTNECRYIISFYNSAYSIPGQYTSYEDAYTRLTSFNEYIILLSQLLIGQFLNAYTFGGMTAIIQNLDQGSNFFMEKTDLMRDHLFFYNIEKEVRNDVIVYYDYLWQRHKDIIYGKHHFSLLSKSLREKFEKFNLLGNEIYLHTFHKLQNDKLTGHVLRELKKLILLPFEILFEEGALAQGLYILTNGEIEFTSYATENSGHSFHSVKYSDILDTVQKQRRNGDENFDKAAQEMTVIFPLVSIFIKTGRTYRRCSTIDFADFLYLPLSSFDEIVSSFPVEMHSLKHEVMQDVEKQKLFENNELFKVISVHSARSVGKNYEKEYTKLSIWIPIPIPISQRKLATNYIESFVKIVKNQWKEILLSSDMNICLNSMMVVGFLKQDNKDKSSKNKEEENDKNMLIQQGDQLDLLKNLSKTVSNLSEEFNLIARSFMIKD